MQAELKIAGLDEAIKDLVYKAVKEAVKEIVEPVLEGFKSEMIVASQEEVLKKQIWTKKDIMVFTSRSKSWVDRLNRYKDFPKKLNHSNNDTAYWDRDEILRFFARHSEIPTTAQKYLKDKK